MSKQVFQEAPKTSWKQGVREPMNPSQFYNQLNRDYLHWSKNLNIHFGYFRWPDFSSLFFSEKMLVEMNNQVMERLGTSDGATLLDA
ncbi:MAG TPA: hypothetical protein ENJ20_06065, partial [Bacteroidetes bacterium]|nr:hypothetical protein [Bacteroidota bacterium]